MSLHLTLLFKARICEMEQTRVRLRSTSSRFKKGKASDAKEIGSAAQFLVTES